MTCPTCHKPTPPDSVHTCSPVPLLAAKDFSKVRDHYPYVDEVDIALLHAETGRVACYDTQAGVFVPFMSEAEAREKWRNQPEGLYGDEKLNLVDMGGYLAALRDAGVIK